MNPMIWKSLVFIFVIYLFVEGLIYLGLIFIDKSYYITYDPNISSLSEDQKISLRNFINRKKGEHTNNDQVLGWSNFSQANSAVYRDNREYESAPPTGIIRISAFGDSFTYGSDVELEDTWEKQLTELDNSLEVLNYGVGAYGLDQAYLLYLRVGTDYNPQIVFIGFMSENIARHVNVFRAFYTRQYRDVIFTKPRFKVLDSKLVLLENPISTFEDHEHFLLNDSEVLKKIGENDYHYQLKYNRGTFDFLPSVRLLKIFWYGIIKIKKIIPVYNLNGMYNTGSEAYQVTLKIFDDFYRKVLDNGALPIILIFPDLSDQWSSRKNNERRYTPLLGYFQSNGYYFIDTLSALEPYESRYTVDDLTKQWGHYSPVGNRIIAEYIYSRLKNWDLTNLSILDDAFQKERKRLGVNAQ